MVKKKYWYDFLWIYSVLYLALGFFNILFAWLGVIEFFIPLVLSLTKWDKFFCNDVCGRGQLFDLLGNKLKLSRKRKPPLFFSTSWFRYAFLSFFMIMFILMIITTVNIFQGVENLKEVVTILWTFKVPWKFASPNLKLSPWIIQFAFGMYSIMFTSSILGFVTMLIYRPRTWCVYCPMGTMTQGICKLKYRNK